MIKISIGQALLILIDQYQKNLASGKTLSGRIIPVKEIAAIKKLYLSGVEDEADTRIDKVLQEIGDSCLFADYEILKDAKVINRDHTRRYFETHLAIETLHTTLGNLDQTDLEAHFKSLYDEFPGVAVSDHKIPIQDKVKTTPPDLKQQQDELARSLVREAFEDESLSFASKSKPNESPSLSNLPSLSMLQQAYRKTTHVNYVKEVKEKYSKSLLGFTAENILEYSSVAKRIKTGKYYKFFSSEERLKLNMLTRCAFLSIPILNCLYKEKPINHIYSTVLNFRAEYQGRSDRGNSNEVVSNNLGLLRSYAPPASKDDEAYCDESSCYGRPADRNDFKPEALGPKKNFAKTVHPYSCGIAGQTMTVCEIFLHLHRKRILRFDTEKKLRTFLKCFFSMMIYNSGDHTFYEFCMPLALPEVRSLFHFIKNFDRINLESLMYAGNEKAFDKALQKTIVYNNQLLQRTRVNHAITQPTVERTIQRGLLPMAIAAFGFVCGRVLMAAIAPANNLQPVIKFTL